MINRLKINVLVVLIASLLIAGIIAKPYTYIAGKTYYSNQDYTCCKGNQLYVHHFYIEHFLWIRVASGYTTESIGKPNDEGCNIQCTDDIK